MAGVSYDEEHPEKLVKACGNVGLTNKVPFVGCAEITTANDIAGIGAFGSTLVKPPATVEDLYNISPSDQVSP